MDIQMPIMDGKEALSTLRALGFSKPVYALTANVITSDVEEYAQLGFDGSLGKPIDMNAFYQVWSKHLKAGNAPTKRRARAGGDPLIAQLRLKFQAEISDYLERINTAESHADFEALHQVVHIIKGTAGSFGFMEVTEQAGRISRCPAPTGPRSRDIPYT